MSTLLDTTIKAKETFYQNADVMIAGFLIRHPDIDPADVELVMAPVPGEGLRFSIEPKELHVPPVCTEMDYPGDVDDSADREKARSYLAGWNDCRQAMIAKAKAQRPSNAMVASLSSVTPESKDG